MSAAQDPRGDAAGELARAFDRAYAAPRPERPPRGERFLAVDVGRRACALRLAAVRGLSAAPAIEPLPGDLAARLGLAWTGGRLVAVWDLGVLLGEEPGARRWLALAGAVGLAFDAFRGLFEAGPEGRLSLAGPEGPGGLAAEGVVREGVVRAVIEVPAVLAAIEKECGR